MRSSKESNLIHSDVLTIMPEQGRVEADGKTIRLGPVNMRVLVLLLENQGRVVARNTIFDMVWSNQVVSDDTLTRCISDLRTQLGKLVSATKLIETIPKRGYQWLPEIDSTAKKPVIKEDSSTKYIKIILLTMVGLFLLSTTFLWVANQMLGSGHIKIALMPQQTSSANQELLIDVGELLREDILETKNMGYLSASVLKERGDNNFSYLSKEYGARWIIEWKIRDIGDSKKITLNLVDARTALVVHSVNMKFEPNQVKLKALCDAFIKDVVRYLD